jgi:hypothetical protein
MHSLVSLPYPLTSIYGQGLYKINISSWYCYVAGVLKKKFQNPLHIGKLYVEQHVRLISAKQKYGTLCKRGPTYTSYIATYLNG